MEHPKDEIEDVTKELPLGMGMALAQNEPARERFAALPGGRCRTTWKTSGGRSKMSGRRDQSPGRFSRPLRRREPCGILIS